VVKKVIVMLVFVGLIDYCAAQDTVIADTVTVQSGNLNLRGLLLHPKTVGKLPTVSFVPEAMKLAIQLMIRFRMSRQ